MSMVALEAVSSLLLAHPPSFHLPMDLGSHHPRLPLPLDRSCDLFFSLHTFCQLRASVQGPQISNRRGSGASRADLEKLKRRTDYGNEVNITVIQRENSTPLRFAVRWFAWVKILSYSPAAGPTIRNQHNKCLLARETISNLRLLSASLCVIVEAELKLRVRRARARAKTSVFLPTSHRPAYADKQGKYFFV